MALAIALLLLVAVFLLLLAALGVTARVNLVILAAACVVLAYGLPAIQAGLS